MKIISVHVPKTAGISLAAEFKRIFGDRLLRDYRYDPLHDSGIHAGVENLEFPAGTDVVHGHFHARCYQADDAYMITFLRHPVNLMISLYFHALAIRPRWWHLWPPSRIRSERPLITDFAAHPVLQKMLSERFFGGFDMSRFDFVGFHETRQQDMERLSAELGLNLSSQVRLNVTPFPKQQAQIEQDTHTIAKLTDILADDIAFYESLRC